MRDFLPSHSTSALVELRNVSYTAGGVSILRAIDLSVQAGERVALLGANGAGKTSVLRVVNGLLLPSSGSMVAPQTRAQAMIFQKPPLLRRNVVENIAYVLRVRGLAAHEAQQRALQTIDRCGLTGLAHRYARSLSGGEQQKLALARAWVAQPTLLLADEPTASLAPAAVHDLERIVREMCDSGATLIFATHNRGQAKRLATRVLFMSEGRLVEDRTAQDFFTNPLSQEAIDYLSVERI
jgi:tungstate transport system ATP-binding protein